MKIYRIKYKHFIRNIIVAGIILLLQLFEFVNFIEETNYKNFLNIFSLLFGILVISILILSYFKFILKRYYLLIEDEYIKIDKDDLFKKTIYYKDITEIKYKYHNNKKYIIFIYLKNNKRYKINNIYSKALSEIQDIINDKFSLYNESKSLYYKYDIEFEKEYLNY